jgi:hypothetical protein
MTDVVDTPTAEEITQHFNACGHSVDLVNGIIDGSQMADDSQEDKNDAVDRNVQHLEIQEAKQWYIDDSVSRTSPADKASITAAITAGKAYLA